MSHILLESASDLDMSTILRILTTALQCFAILLTFFRLWHRFSIQRFWWEDVWAVVAVLCSIASLVSSFWVHWQFQASLDMSIFAYWVYTIGFACAVWAVRMSVLYSTIRLISSAKTSRWIAISVTSLFALLWGGIVGWKVYYCAPNLEWYDSPSHTCFMPRSNVFYELATDVISDAILVALPLRMLWNIKLPQKQQRKMILCIFSSSMVVSFVSIFRAISRLSRRPSNTLPASNFEVACCLIVCNFLVIVTYLYRRFRTIEDDDSIDTSADTVTDPNSHTNTSPATALYLTTIDLEHLGESGPNSDSNASKDPRPLDLSIHSTSTSYPLHHQAYS
ncbi:hypothetical protein BJ138DRAFT_1161198 [Hygrophoropsis aurantiaca]|uniref:Uncharacterized protein n=1 Tax=Hygrophoropsis aurantiaca TaxID=72124 RepID=A0ACB8A1X7_9AGAM|nr:hypothetical protein BJ138DRAFT_1161198 [Hygrophoropsis aurantiaca]